MDPYLQFLQGKVARAERTGFDPPSPPHPSLFGHQRDICRWLAVGGRRACFANFGLGKTRMNLQMAKWVTEVMDGKYLIVAPLGVRGEFTNHDGPAMGIDVAYARTDAEAFDSPCRTIITNYERVREGDVTPSKFSGAGLDEADCLRSFGSATYQNFLRFFKNVKYKWVFTATPSPNKAKEIIHYSGFLSLMDTGDCLTRFFQRDSQKAGNLTLMPHMKDAFYYWLSTWAAFLLYPSDLGYSDEGYRIPPFHMHWRRLEEDYRKVWGDTDSWGQFQLMPGNAQGLKKAAASKRNSIMLRVAEAMSILKPMMKPHGRLSDQVVIWADLNSEQDAMEKALKKAKISFTSLRGSQGIDEREEMIQQWRERETDVFLSKTSMYGGGVNLQQSHTMIYVGINYKARDFMQGIRREVRFMQKHEVDVYAIYLESEDGIKSTLETKIKNHDALTLHMSEMVKENKLLNLGTL